ncbi:MAG: N-acetylmuramidase domain-containing protein, partial [Anaerolineae bacterium]|nr:N-acetylmuramidase domain-containing protein [Anaerolineae bacterium]
MALKGTVTTAILNVRKTTSTALKAIGQIKRGTVVDVLDNSDENWAKIRLADGTVAYVASDYLNIEEVEDEVTSDSEPIFEPYKVVITTQSLNVRPLAGTSKAAIGTVKIDRAVTVLEELGDWYRISYAGRDGYIFASFTRKLLPGEKITRGYLIEDAELMSISLVPERIIPTDNLEVRKRPEVTARIWNENGNLIKAIADRYNIPVAAIVGVIGTESAGNFFHRDTGKVTIRFEVHQFYKYWGKLNETLFNRHFQFSREARKGWTQHKFRANTEEEWDWVHNGQVREHEILEFARSLDNTAALKSISMGGAQIMGFNYSRLGYESVQQMYDAFARSSHAQILGLFDFVKGARATSPAIEALQKRDFFTFASYYNGSGREATYEDLMESFAAHFDKLIKTAVKVEPVQIDASDSTEADSDSESDAEVGGDSPSVGVPVDVITPPVDDDISTDNNADGEKTVTPEPALDPVMAIPTARLNYRADARSNSKSFGILERNVALKITE